jgi:hypothetical protein
MARKNKKLDAAVKVTQASKFFSFNDGELAEAQSLIEKDEAKKKKALEKEEKERIKAENEKFNNNKFAEDAEKRRQAEELDLLDKLFGEK